MVIFVEDRLNDTDEQRAAKTEGNRARQADVPVYIAQVSAVIPPAHAPFPLQQEAGAILQHGTEQCRQQECVKLPVLHAVILYGQAIRAFEGDAVKGDRSQ